MTFRPTMKSLKAFAVAAFASAAMFGGTADAQWIDYNYLSNSPVRVESNSNVGNSPGVHRGYQRTGAFMSIFEDSSSILFLDGHGNVNYDSGNFSGDLGVGYRQDMGGMVLGGNAYYNYREYSNGFSEHNFSTLGFGVEALMSDWAVRSNAYVSLDNERSNGRTAFLLPGGPDLVPQMGGSMGVSNIRLATQTENFDEALDGFDLNISHKLPVANAELGAGVYYLSAGNGPDTWGVNGTAEAWLASNIAANVTVSHDDLFDTTVYGGVSMYFGGPAIDADGRKSNVISRLWSRVQRRNVVPVLNYTNAAPDLLATNPADGDLITVAQIGMGGDLLNAPDLLEDDGDFIDIILVDPDATFAPMDTIALNDDQRLLSAQLFHGVDTTEFGFIDIPETGLGGGPASITGLDGIDVITLGNNSEVSGFMLTAMGNASGIIGTDVTGFNINNNIIAAAGQDGIEINTDGLVDASGVIFDNMITDAGDEGIDLQGDNLAVDIFGNTILRTDNDAIDIDIDGEFIGFIGNNMLNDNGSSGLEISAETINAIITQNIANNNDDEGFDIEVDNTSAPLLISLNTTNLNGDDGISVIFEGDLDSTVDIMMNTADGNDGDGISVVSNGMGDILGSITNNTTNGNDPGIFVAANDAASDIMLDIIGNVAGANDEEGILIEGAGSFSGLIQDNFASLNGSDGLGIFVAGDINADIIDNMFLGNDSDGLESSATNYTGTVSGNVASGNDEAGLYFFADGNIDLDVLNNVANDNDNTGSTEDAGITLAALGNVMGTVDGNTANGNTQSGLFIGADNDGDNAGDVTATVSNNTANDNGSAGESGISISGENVTGSIVDNTANDNDGGGIVVDAVNDALVGNVFDNTTNDNGDTGLSITAGNDIFAFTNINTANDNGGGGIVIDAGNNFTGDVFANVANGNTDDGINLTADGSINGFAMGNGVRFNTANGNGDDGINIDAASIGTMMSSFIVDGNTTGVAGMMATGNGDDGIEITTTGDAFVTFTNNNSAFNGSGFSGNGLQATIGGNWIGDVSGNTALENSFTNLFLDVTGDFTGDVSGNTANDSVNFGGIGILADNFTGDVLMNTTNGNDVDGLFLGITTNFTGDFMNNTATGNAAFDYNTDAGGTVTGTTSPNTSTTNTAADFAGNIASP